MITVHAPLARPVKRPDGSLVTRGALLFSPDPAEFVSEFGSWVVQRGEAPIQPDGTFSVQLEWKDGLSYDVHAPGVLGFRKKRFTCGTGDGQIADNDTYELSDLLPVAVPVGVQPALYAKGDKGDPAPTSTRVVTMGDSINAAGAFALHGTTWTSAMCELSDQQFLFAGNTATGGETTTQIAARIYQALLLDPDVITFTGGANDLASSGTLPTFQANVTALANKARDADVLFVPATVTPLPNLNAGGQAALLAWNAWLTEFAAERGLPLLDFHALLTDGGTGFAPGFNSGDNIHPSQAAHVAMATLALETLTLRGLGLAGSPERRALGRGNLAPNPTLTDGGGAVPDGWHWTPATGHTGARVEDPDFRGQAFHITVASATGGLGQFNTNAIPVTAGRTMLLSMQHRVDDSTASAASFKGLRFEAWWSGAPWVTPLVQGFVAERGLARWHYEITVPAGITSLTLVVLVNAIQAGEVFDCLLGEPIVRDVT